MDGQPRLVHRMPVFLLMVAALILAAVLGVWNAQQSSGADGGRTLQTDLMNHNKNDAKDGCPNDGNAGRGNDNKGPNGGCRQHPPAGQYGQACNNPGKGRPPFCNN